MMNLTRKFQAATRFLFLIGLAINAWAGPGDGIGIGSWVFSPYLSLNFTDDSNVYKANVDEVQDTFFEPEIGLKFSSSSKTNLLSLRGNLFYADRNYNKESSEDFNSYGDNVTFRYGDGRRTMIELAQSYRNVDDLDRHAADLDASVLSEQLVEDNNALDVPRDIFQAGGLVSQRVTDKTELGLSYRYSGVFYNDESPVAAPGEPENLGELDLDGHILQLNGALALTDKTDALLTLRQGLQHQEGTDGAADFTTARIGLKTMGSDKVVYRLEGGLERYARPEELDDGEENLYFSFSGSVDWFVTEKVTFRCGAYNGTQFSAFYQGNTYEFVSGWAGLGYRWTPAVTLSARAVYRKDDYADSVEYAGQTVERLDDRLEGHLRLDYVLPISFLRLYAEATYDEVDSNLEPVDYVDRRFILGAILRY